MTNQEAVKYIESILELVYMDLYPTHSTIRKTGYNANWMSVLTKDVDDAVEMLELNNLHFEVKENPYKKGYSQITIFIQK
tara:strand:+ start:96 stop:335 length:240 start_codon:yes stop_codon:yes gene_type:complete